MCKDATAGAFSFLLDNIIFLTLIVERYPSPKRLQTRVAVKTMGR